MWWSQPSPTPGKDRMTIQLTSTSTSPLLSRCQMNVLCKVFVQFGVAPALSQDINLFSLPGIRWGGIQCEATKAVLRKQHRLCLSPSPAIQSVHGCPSRSASWARQHPWCSAAALSQALFELAASSQPVFNSQMLLTFWGGVGMAGSC